VGELVHQDELPADSLHFERCVFLGIIFVNSVMCNTSNVLPSLAA